MEKNLNIDLSNNEEKILYDDLNLDGWSLIETKTLDKLIKR